MARNGQQKTRELAEDGRLGDLDGLVMPPDNPFDEYTVHLYSERQDAMLRAEDKRRSVGGFCEITVPEECLIYTESDALNTDARIPGMVPIQYIDIIQVGVAEDEDVSDLSHRIDENEDWNVEFRTYPEDLSRI